MGWSSTPGVRALGREGGDGDPAAARIVTHGSQMVAGAGGVALSVTDTEPKNGRRRSADGLTSRVGTGSITGMSASVARGRRRVVHVHTAVSVAARPVNLYSCGRSAAATPHRGGESRWPA